MSILILFPNQIFEDFYLEPILKLYSISEIILLEHPVFFGIDPERTINFNKMKLVLHRACFYFYRDYLLNLRSQKKNNKNLRISHILIDNFKTFTLDKNKKNYYIDVPDYLVDKRMKELDKNITKIVEYHPSYIFSHNDFKEYLKENEKKKKKGYFHKQFYEWGRKRLNILMDEEGNPLGGTFSYDKYNRGKPPKDADEIPDLPKISSKDNQYISNAKKDIEKEFPNNYGNTDLYIPVTFEGAQKWLVYFINNRLENFGLYQDAVLKSESFMYHSIISPLLNCGLLTPDLVINEIQEYYDNHFNENIEILYSVEGFIRQILGWREWQRFIYFERFQESVSSNYYENTRKLSNHWYNGTLGVEPIDDTIKSAYKNAYLHHILRLMYMSNFMTLCRIHPDEMYYWFMSFSMDSYDWVMIQNVYGMGSFADGGMTTTKPYITTGSYIVRMSDYRNGNWAKLWEALYYIFIKDNLEKLVKFPRVGGIMRKNLERKSEEQLKEYRKLVNDFFNKTQ